MRNLTAGSLILFVVTLSVSSGSFGQTTSAPARGEIRVVDKSTANWVFVTMHVFDHLVEMDKSGTLVPRLASSWKWLDDRTLEFKLRQGVKFHNGEKFDAEIVKLNWEELTKRRQPHINGAYMNFKPGSKLGIVDPQTIRFSFSEPDGGALVKIAVMHIANRQFYREVGWGEEHW
jgi:peptide/nickel transport system substrate-binding protein